MSDEIKTVPEEEAEEAFRTDEIYSYHARKIGHSHHRHSRGKKAVKAAVITLAALPFVLARGAYSVLSLLQSDGHQIDTLRR